MNILIIDDGLLPFYESKSPNKKAVFQYALANMQLSRELAKVFSALSHNVLLITSSEDGTTLPRHFEYSGEGGFLSLKAVLTEKEEKGAFSPLKYSEFGKLTEQNSAVLTALFKPDVILCSSLFPFSISAAKKIAEMSGAVLTAVLSCSYGTVIKSLGADCMLNPVLTVLKRRTDRALLKCNVVFGYYPRVVSDFPRAIPLVPPPISVTASPSAEAVFIHDSVAAFSGGGIFTLCCCSKLLPNRSAEALIAAVKGLGKRFILAIVGDGEYKSTLRRIAREQGVTEVCFYNGVPDEDIPFVISAADAAFVAESNFCKGCFPEYSDFLQVLSAKKPTIAATEENADFIKICSGVVMAKPNDCDSIRNAITKLMSLPYSRRSVLGNLCGEFASAHNFDTFAKEFLSELDNLVLRKEK